MNFFSAARSSALALLLVLPAAFFSLAHAESVDGRRFEGVFIERGKTSGDADTLIFKDGRFHSTACDQYGYSDAPYKTVTAGDTVRFEAETVSAKYGKLLWAGAIRGGKLDATV